jgi:hypothetical protein
MRQITGITIVLLLFSSCTVRIKNNLISNYIDSSIKTDENNIPLDSNQFYFPVRLFRDTSIPWSNDTFVVSWYSEQLRAMKEPLLFNKRENKDIFRFTWLRTFDNPIVIRIEKEQHSIKLYWKLCDGAGGYDPGKMTISEERTINEETWNRFVKLTKEARFWEMGTIEKEPTGLDGEQWILEGKDNSQYHVVHRWSPSSGYYFNCCNFLINEIKIDSSKLKKVVFKQDSTVMTDDGLVYILADEYPKFGNTERDLFNYFSNNIKSYLPSIGDGINGNVIALFVVFENGSVQNIEILKGIRNDIDSASIRLLKSMPFWTPGKVKGKTVKVRLAVPIRIN